jgi:hypothetical protein
VEHGAKRIMKKLKNGGRESTTFCGDIGGGC